MAQAVDPTVRNLLPKYSPDDPGIGSETNADHATLRALAAPFPKSDVQFAPFTADKDAEWAIVGPYVDIRAVRRRLNRVLGVAGYEFTLRSGEGGMVARLEATLPSGQTIAGEDAASNTDVEAHKGGASTAMRRAASSVLGVGEYFYKVGNEVDPYFVGFNEDGNREVNREEAFDKMPQWAMLLPEESQEALVAAAQERGVERDSLVLSLRRSDLPFNAIDEIPVSAKKDVWGLIEEAEEVTADA